MRDIPTPSTDCVPPNLLRSFLTGLVQKPQSDRPACNGKVISVSWRSSIARLSSLRPIAPIIVAVTPFMCMIATSTLLESSACAQIASRAAVHRSVRQIRRGSLRSLRRAGALDSCRHPN